MKVEKVIMYVLEWIDMFKVCLIRV